MEELLYKAKPFLCVVSGVVVFCVDGLALVGQVSAFVLIGCGILIFRHRNSARSAVTRPDNKPGRAGPRAR